MTLAQQLQLVKNMVTTQQEITNLAHGESGLCASLPLACEQGGRIYRNNVRGAQLSALASTFPVCEQLLGTECFAQLALNFTRSNPMTTRDLNFYGRSFPDYLSTAAAQQAGLHALPYLAEVAQLEWHLHAAYYAPARSHFDFAGFAQIPDSEHDQVCFGLAQDVATMQTRYNCLDIVTAHKNQSLDALHWQENNTLLVIHRPAVKVETAILEDNAYRLLAELAAGAPLGQLSLKYGDGITALSQFISRGWIDSWRLGEAFCDLGEVQRV